MTSRAGRHLAAILALLAALLATSLSACGSRAGDEGIAETAASARSVIVAGAWVRATAGTQDTSMTGAFMTIDNPGSADVTLTGASSSVAPVVQLHETARVDGRNVMREVDGGIVVTAGRGKVLMPGGYHVMLMGLERTLAPGDEVDLTLEFSDGTSSRLTVPVKAFTEEEPHYHAPGQGHPSGSMSPDASPMG